MPSEKKPFFGHQYIFLWTPLVKFRLLPNPTHFGSELGIFPFNPVPYPFILCNILNWLLSELIKHVSEMHLNIHFDCDISVIKINYFNWRQSMWIKIHHFEKKIIIMLKIQLCEENSIFWWKNQQFDKIHHHDKN